MYKATTHMTGLGPWSLANKAAANAPTFTKAVRETLAEATSVLDQRSGEYLDSWSLDNQSTPFLDNVLSGFGVSVTPEQKRLVLLASLCDVKLSRLTGPWKQDTAIDLVNYTAALAALRGQYEAKQ
jgi:hypothetical protein